jgi:hypothetical protein
MRTPLNGGMSERWTAQAGNAPHIGERVQFIRWAQSADGWTSEIVSGRYVRLDGEDWVVDVLGEEHHLPRTEWSQCAK